MSDPSFSGGKKEAGGDGMEEAMGVAGRTGRGSIDPCSGQGGLFPQVRDDIFTQTRFMCSSAECGYAGAEGKGGIPAE